eukprot:CAMPEP_0113847860 /NCGR_PEP_ID=MMETSP0372-20130328/2123_1 /TAXON_ID=340204 /ORGANISM="Lankesteria abbotti" /LENGTH=123 /DNA_ID=CAMNT_0000817213 /DNA_START=97 /DNA_END=468 /DNA_ORIENTATION=+ /assembly_acc=CAM_ASM_000359
MKDFESLSYEEYKHASVHLVCKAKAVEDEGEVSVDQLLIKWYVTKVKKCSKADLAKTAQLHHRYSGALERMIHDRLFIVEGSYSGGGKTWRALRVPSSTCVEMLFNNQLEEDKKTAKEESSAM